MLIELHGKGTLLLLLHVCVLGHAGLLLVTVSPTGWPCSMHFTVQVMETCMRSFPANCAV
jgi:hypothetical protein